MITIKDLEAVTKQSLTGPNEFLLKDFSASILVVIEDYKALRNFIKGMEAESNNVNLDIGRLLRHTEDI